LGSWAPPLQPVTTTRGLTRLLIRQRRTRQLPSRLDGALSLASLSSGHEKTGANWSIAPSYRRHVSGIYGGADRREGVAFCTHRVSTLNEHPRRGSGGAAGVTWPRRDTTLALPAWHGSGVAWLQRAAWHGPDTGDARLLTRGVGTLDATCSGGDAMQTAGTTAGAWPSPAQAHVRCWLAATYVRRSTSAMAVHRAWITARAQQQLRTVNIPFHYVEEKSKPVARRTDWLGRKTCRLDVELMQIWSAAMLQRSVLITCWELCYHGSPDPLPSLSSAVEVQEAVENPSPFPVSLPISTTEETHETHDIELDLWHLYDLHHMNRNLLFCHPQFWLHVIMPSRVYDWWDRLCLWFVGPMAYWRSLQMIMAQLPMAHHMKGCTSFLYRNVSIDGQ
jgi:hypothetical protein